ncbi:MAG TPA: RidA family protein, partial [Amycolatopsis sp.]|nr:RidA family protein [Amycolatopsis sp.]
MIARHPGQVPAISGAVVHGGLVYTAGLVAPSVLAGAGTGIEQQVGEVLDLLGTVLAGAGSDLAAVLRLEAYLADTADLPAWNAGFTRIWPSEPPARTTVALTLAAPGALVEIQAVAA